MAIVCMAIVCTCVRVCVCVFVCLVVYTKKWIFFDMTILYRRTSTTVVSSKAAVHKQKVESGITILYL